MDYTTFARVVEQDAALRRRQILQPVGGKGDKIFPPTYPEERRGAGARHVFERRRIDGAEIWCVLVTASKARLTGWKKRCSRPFGRRLLPCRT